MEVNILVLLLCSMLSQAGDTRIPLPRKPLWTLQKNCRLQSWTLYKSADCRWISITILCVSFTNSATVERLEQVQLCNRLIDQSADNITGLKCVKECLILKYKYNPESLAQLVTESEYLYTGFQSRCIMEYGQMVYQGAMIMRMLEHGKFFPYDQWRTS